MRSHWHDNDVIDRLKQVAREIGISIQVHAYNPLHPPQPNLKPQTPNPKPQPPTPNISIPQVPQARKMDLHAIKEEAAKNLEDLRLQLDRCVFHLAVIRCRISV